MNNIWDCLVQQPYIHNFILLNKLHTFETRSHTYRTSRNPNTLTRIEFDYVKKEGEGGGEWGTGAFGKGMCLEFKM